MPVKSMVEAHLQSRVKRGPIRPLDYNEQVEMPIRTLSILLEIDSVELTCTIDYIFRPQGQTAGSAPGYFLSGGSQVMVVARIRVRASVNWVRVRMADGK